MVSQWNLVNPVTNGPQKSGPFDSGDFGKNAFLGHLGLFQHGHLSNEKGHHTFLSTSIAFYDIFLWACTQIKMLWVFGQENELPEDLYAFCFLPFLWQLFLLFCCSYWPSSKLASSSKIPEKVWSRQEILTHGGGKFGFEDFCAHLMLNWSNHLHLGITGKIFSFCRIWVHVM